ncbi:MAG TPA: serine protease [Saprospirales bacterium]|nr:serine protease [Saprospirales bacterium]
MKKFTHLALFALFLLVNSCQKQEPSPAFCGLSDPTELDQLIQHKMVVYGEFLWEWASDEQIWTALSLSDHVLSVGYQPVEEQNVADRLHLLNIQSEKWKQARAEVLRIVLENELRLNPAISEKELLAFKENARLPVFCVVVKNPSTIAALRASKLVRYAEPIGYEPFMATRAADRSGSGCDSNDPDGGLIPGVHYNNITPNCKRSWNFPNHKIQEAWENSTGAGCKVTIIDTGASDDQDNLEAAFNQGDSQGRTIEKFVTLPPDGQPETPHDQCGHGTSMLGACAAPRGEDGAAVGIAYNCDLVSIRAAADVYLNESREVVGVSDAFVQAGESDTKIISMSMGRITTSNQIRDAIKFAFNQEKLIFAAAGTSFWWTSWFWGVIFPASMNECSAVTGMKSNLTSACGVCHKGNKVDFVVVMERVADGKTVLTLADTGDDPSTVGGSSVATASTAGIAALVWAKNPGFSRAQVFDKLKQNGNYWPNRNGNFGWGRINAQTATQ